VLPMISIVVATRNRPKLLTELLNSIQKQALKPIEMIIVDASDEFLDFDHQSYSFEIKHIKSDDPSISRQRNIGKKMISSRSIYLSVLDDDTIPDPTYLKRIVTFLENTDGAIGVSGITDDALLNTKADNWINCIKLLFFLDSPRSGTLTKGAVNIGLRTKELFPIESEWLIGCSVFKINKIKNLFYDHSLDGYSLGEDVIFSYEASKSGKLYILPDVRLPHRQSSESTHYRSQYWFKWASYRKTLISIMPGSILKWIYYGWSNLGQIVMVLFTRKSSTGLNRLSSVFAIIRGTLRG